MASLTLEHVGKKYPNGFEGVKDFNLEIADKEFIIFVGPSGCGKSTTLRMIAGLEDITSGTLKIDGRVVNDVEPKDRDIAMVFQTYALYPHMSVYDNMAFPLKLRKVDAKEIDKAVREAARILDLEKLLGARDVLVRRERAHESRDVEREGVHPVRTRDRHAAADAAKLRHRARQLMLLQTDVIRQDGRLHPDLLLYDLDIPDGYPGRSMRLSRIGPGIVPPLRLLGAISDVLSTGSRGCPE